MKDFIDFIKCLFTIEHKYKPEPDCNHCHGLGYDASGFLCTCVKNPKKPPPEKSSVTLPDTLTNSDGETPEYVNGWNDCRQLMMEMIRKESK